MQRMSEIKAGRVRDAGLINTELGVSLEEIVHKVEFLPVEAVHLPDSEAVNTVNPSGLRDRDTLRLGTPKGMDPYGLPPGFGTRDHRQLRVLARRNSSHISEFMELVPGQDHWMQEALNKEEKMLAKIRSYVLMMDEIRGRMAGL